MRSRKRRRILLLGWNGNIRSFEQPVTIKMAVMVDQAVIKDVVRRILKVARLESIILFGSAATGQMTPDSDIDLLVVEAAPSNTREESVRLRKALRGMGFPFDVIVMASDRFAETKNVIGGIAYPANKYGRVIYEVA